MCKCSIIIWESKNNHNFWIYSHYQLIMNEKMYNLNLTVFSQWQLGHFLSCFSAFFFGIIIAFACCWEVALLALLVVPLISAIGATYTKKMNAISGMRMVYMSEAASMVEQVRTWWKSLHSYVKTMENAYYSNSWDTQEWYEPFKLIRMSCSPMVRPAGQS